MWNKYLPRTPDRDRLSMLIGVVLLGLAITQFVQLPSKELGAVVLGSTLGISLSGYWMIVGVLAILASTGTDMLIRSHPNLRDGRLRATFVTWILPGLTVLAAGRVLLALPSWPLWWAGLIVTGALFGAVVTAEYRLFSESQPTSSRPRLLLNVVAYVLALVLYAAIYQTRSRSLITATATWAVSFLVALDLLWWARAGLGRAALLAGIMGLVLAECSWALNYWRASIWTASLLLLVTFYVASGIASQYLMDKLSRRVLGEFAVVAIILIGLLIAFHP